MDTHFLPSMHPLQPFESLRGDLGGSSDELDYLGELLLVEGF